MKIPPSSFVNRHIVDQAYATQMCGDEEPRGFAEGVKRHEIPFGAELEILDGGKSRVKYGVARRVVDFAGRFALLESVGSQVELPGKFRGHGSFLRCQARVSR